MPEPVKRERRYVPGLDGLRAVAVLAVIAYHLNAGWAPGGLLGVGVFFTLSGYLITDILLGQVNAGGIRLKAFWLARARRLLPALFLMLVAVAVWVTVAGPAQPPDFRAAMGTAAVYVNNWWLIFHDVSYFHAFAAPGPLNHLWSLSVEEQFYIVWPLLLMLGVRLIPRVTARTRTRPRLAGMTLLLALGSGALMVALYHPGLDPSRVYYGTDTRALELLVGAALAMVWPSRRLRSHIPRSARRTIDVAGLAGLAVIVVMVARCGEYSPFLYRGGFLLLSGATAVVVASLVHPAGSLGGLVGCDPLRWVGERSYGIYLWHFPIIVLTTPAGAEGFDALRALGQVGATFAVAALSWRFVEDPIRHGALGRLRERLRARRSTYPWRAWAGAAAAAALVGLAFAGLAGAGIQSGEPDAPGKIHLARTITAAHVRAGPLRTSCRSVVHIGDSTSEGLVGGPYAPRRRQRIPTWYARVGVKHQQLDISGARSIYEKFQGEANAHDVALKRRKGYHGCWVLALGTNEAADVAAGSSVGLDQRIKIMMSTIGPRHVLWVDVRSLLGSGPYAEPNMQAWDDALAKACRRYPTMRVYDWASDVHDDWFIEDGIHFTPRGYAARGRLIAHALATAFPRGGGMAPGCMIHSGPRGAHA